MRATYGTNYVGQRSEASDNSSVHAVGCEGSEGKRSVAHQKEISIIVSVLDLWRYCPRLDEAGKAAVKGRGTVRLGQVNNRSQDVWDLNEIHALTANPSHAEGTSCSHARTCPNAIAPCHTLQIRNRFEKTFVC